MSWSYQAYLVAGLSISFGSATLIFAVLCYLICRCPRTFYRMIKSMFSIKRNEAIPPDGIESIDFYGVVIDLPATALGLVPRFALIIMPTAVLTATFMLFISGIIFISEYLSPNSKCPSQGEMDCFTTTDNTYFYCNSSDTRINESLGSVVCYRWVKENLGTVDVLNQIGLCSGLIQAFRWFVNVFLRVLLHALQQKRQTASTNVADISSRRWRLLKMFFKHSVVILISLSPCVVLIVLGAKNISRTGITMVILSTLFLVSLSGLLLFLFHEKEKFKHGNIAYNKFDTIPVSPPPMILQSIAQQDIPKQRKQDTANKGTKISITKIVPIIH